MEFWQGHGRLFVQEVASGKRAPVATTGQALDFTPAFSPDGKTLAFSRATEEGTDLYTVNIQGRLLLTALDRGPLLRQLVTDLQSRRPADRVRVDASRAAADLRDAADGTDQQLFAPFDYGATGSSNRARSGRPTADGRLPPRRGWHVAGVRLDVRTRAVRTAHSVGRNEDPTWAPDSRHYGVSCRSFGVSAALDHRRRNRPHPPAAAKSGARLPAWSPRLPETASVDPLKSERTSPMKTPTLAPAEAVWSP